MVLDIRIKIFGNDSFRPRLSSGDVIFGNGDIVDVASSNDALSNDDVQFIEEALVFTDAPIVIPNMTYLHSSKLWSLKSPLLERVVRDLMFLNPTISSAGINKMVSWIVSYFVGVSKADEFKKVLSYEDLRPVVSFLCDKYIGGDVDIVESNRVILYKRDSLLEGSDKRWYSNFYRRKRVSALSEELIHEGALLASKTIYKKLVISKSIVLRHTSDMNSLVTLNKHIGNRTIKFLADENYIRCFKTQASADKFIEFTLIYSPEIALDYYTKELSISKTSALEFKKLINK